MNGFAMPGPAMDDEHGWADRFNVKIRMRWWRLDFTQMVESKHCHSRWVKREGWVWFAWAQCPEACNRPLFEAKPWPLDSAVLHGTSLSTTPDALKAKWRWNWQSEVDETRVG